MRVCGQGIIQVCTCYYWIVGIQIDSFRQLKFR